MSKNLKAKFVCHSVKNVIGGQFVEAHPVTGGSEENKTYATASPGGKLELYINNPEAFDAFKPGGKFTLDIVQVDE